MITGLFLGSFNPIHIGHLAIANYVLEYGAIEELWFVVSPQNPLKDETSLLADYHRLELVKRAIKNVPKMKASDVEFGLPKPSYTIDTLAYLSAKYPQREFVLLMGADNLQHLHKWKDYETLLEKYPLLVYPRPGCESSVKYPEARVEIINAPLMEISASFIRKALKEGRDIRFFLHEQTFQYLDAMNFYRK